MRPTSFPSALIVAAVLITPPIAARAQSTGLDDMVGARAGQAEGELQRRGYRNVRGEKGDDRSYTYWWNADRRQCVTIATMDGRYDSITPTTAPDCRQPGSNADGRSRQRRDAPRAGRAGIDQSDLSRFCKGEAAAAFDMRPDSITANAPIRQRNGSLVQGWFDAGKRTTFFTCRFDADGRFLSVN